MATKTQGFQFRLTEVSGFSFLVRTKQNIRKRIQNILYLEEPPNDAVDLEYVGSKELLPLNNLYIADKSDEIYGNSRNNTLQELIGERSASSVIVTNKNFLITQEFIDNTNSPIPLYFKHELSILTKLETVRILDKESNEVSTNKYKIVPQYIYNEDTGISTGEIDKYYIFNSLENTFNEKTGEYNIFFLEYVEDISGTETLYVTLLNNEPAYIKATWSDFWPIRPGVLKPWVRAYHLEDSTVGYDNYQVSLPASKKYAIKYLEQDRIAIKYPSSFSKQDPWFPRIVNGGFLNIYSGYLAKYNIPEFSNQAFNPIEPFKLSVHSDCKKVTDSIIKLSNRNIVFGSMFSSLDIVIKEEDEIIYAITSDNLKDGDVVYNEDGSFALDEEGIAIRWDNSSLLGIDRYSGLVYLDLQVLDKYDMYATYSYQEEYFTITSLMMNPIFDLEATKELRVIYLVPKNVKNRNSSTQTSSIKYLRVSKSGIILANNQTGSDGNIQQNIDTVILNSNGYSIIGLIGLHYSKQASTVLSSSCSITTEAILSVLSTDSFPRSGWLRGLDSSSQYRYFKYIDKTDTTFILSDSSSHVPTNGIIFLSSNTTIELVNFIDEFSAQTTRDRDLEISGNGETSLPSIFCQYFVVGELSICPPHRIADLTRIDVREDGGGIIEDKYEEAKLLNPEVQWFNDYHLFDGQPYPGNAVQVVKLPISLKNKFSLSQIKSIVSENITMGTYPLIRFYGYTPRIIDIYSSANGEITIEWEKEGSEFVYNIWYAKQENGEYYRANSVRITDGAGDYNSFVISNLSEGTAYFIKITMEDKYYKWWYGYSDYDSIEGGLGLEEEEPTPPFGNIVGFQFNLII